MRPRAEEGGRSQPDARLDAVKAAPEDRTFLDAPDVPIDRDCGGTGMDDLTAQEQELILTLRYLRSFSVIVHRNGRWRIILADHDASRTEVGEGLDFESAWIELSVSAQTTLNRSIIRAEPYSQ